MFVIVFVCVVMLFVLFVLCSLFLFGDLVFVLFVVCRWVVFLFVLFWRDVVCLVMNKC